MAGEKRGKPAREKKRTAFSPQRKDKAKALRAVAQAVILLALSALIVNAVFFPSKYRPESSRPGADNGFIALSYFGMARDSTSTLIGQDDLRAHLAALRLNGYVTVSQQELIDYYQTGAALPENALFLMFEDGRRDTATFAQDALEGQNYLATMLTYAQNMDVTDPKFLNASDVRDILDTTYWELGSGGYRLAYINAFDRYGHFLGTLTSYEFDEMRSYLGLNYNHYLMDYMRDERGIPVETVDEMRARVGGDYELMKKAYEGKVGVMPKVYALMHANTGSFGINERVSDVNMEHILSGYAINFNREGDSLNTRASSPYDLTRMQPQSTWSANHLLMRIGDDIRREMRFVDGETARKERWDTLQGASEFRGADITVTTVPGGRGTVRLRGAEFADAQVGVTLGGNVLGTQTLYLRANEDLSKYVSVRLTDGVLYVCENTGGGETVLFTADLGARDGGGAISVEEHRLEAERQYLRTRVRYDQNPGDLMAARAELARKEAETARTVAEGAEAYIPQTGSNARGERALSVRIVRDTLDIWVDGAAVAESLPLALTDAGALLLEGAYNYYGHDPYAVADDVYDAVFSDLVVVEPLDRMINIENYANLTRIFDNRLESEEAVAASLAEVWRNVVNWFVDVL